ncbi:MAG: polysaccharide pyruvyl transferase family protein [Terrisporobacter othiniensis]|uniref:polysaccharide pyruvyl transferase family protein n=1 Tax=Terrisporobacter othiniensis TaxID=1577792 RepID=UPI00290808A0|nr:polysaccharide pyruvyl transferase family protein [Terrisporobacter othiniensis]MDU6983197.1 polysaccharide pyruvyl transferase family protein [Terrisporobacter othiniensis]
MSIGVVTFHKAVNYGAVLQTYALQNFICNKGIQCEVIDYNCDAFKDNYKAFKVYNKNLKGFISALVQYPHKKRKNKKFEEFRKNYIHISSTAYSKETIYQSNKIYNKFIVGSDQVWNYELTGFDKTYFLDFVKDNNKKNSYAASIGHDDLNEEIEKQYKELLKNYKNISLREYSGCNLVSKLTQREILKVLDPVFLLDKKQWSSVACNPSEAKYIFVYLLNDYSLIPFVERLSKITGYKVICLQNSMKKRMKAKYVLDAGVNEFIGLINKASYVVTDSFHGVAFSIIFNKNFWAKLNNNGKGKNSRITTLLDDIDLSHRIIKNQSDDEIIECIEYSNANVKLQYEVEKSKKFINEMLNNG